MPWSCLFTFFAGRVGRLWPEQTSIVFVGGDGMAFVDMQGGDTSAEHLVVFDYQYFHGSLTTAAKRRPIAARI